MKNFVSEVYKKAEEVLFVDKIKTPEQVKSVLSSEMYYLLKQYFDVKKNSFSSSIFVEKDGELNIMFSFKATRVLMKRTNLNE